MGDESDSDSYERIWKQVYPCIKECLVDEYQNVNEMLCMHNWPVVHTTCKDIISTGMKKLNIDDPHEFDKAVCWKVVEKEWDIYTKWRCICVFFLAAAMELVIVMRWEEGEFKKVKATGGESPIKSDKDGHQWSVFDLFKRVDDLHKKTVALDEKHDKIHDKLHEIMKNTSNNVQNATNTQVVHVTYGHPYGHPSQALIPAPKAADNASADGLEELMRKILDIARTKGGVGYDPRGESYDERPAQRVYN